MTVIMIKLLTKIVLFATVLLVSCRPSDDGDTIRETITTNLSNKDPIRLYNYDEFIVLTGVYCDFFQNYKQNKESYSVLMKKLNKKKWKFEYIYMETKSCWNDSLDIEFLRLNKNVFGKKLKSITFEEGVITFSLYDSNEGN
jgi:hypothetical protein